jgi:hypothetical protein
MFGAATHCPLLPITRLVHEDTTIAMPQGEVCKGINQMLVSAMHGNDSNWVTPFE